MDAETAKNAFMAGQDAAFRQTVLTWAQDEDISDADFGRLVGDLEWRMMMDRLKWLNENDPKNRVDASRTDDVE